MQSSQFFKNYENSALYLIFVQPFIYGIFKLLKPFDRQRAIILFWIAVGSASVAGILALFSPVPAYTSEHVEIYQFDHTAFQRGFYLIFAATSFIVYLVSGVTRKSPSLPSLSTMPEKRKLKIETGTAFFLLVILAPLFLNYLDTLTGRSVFLMVLASVMIGWLLLYIEKSRQGLAVAILLLLIGLAYFYIFPFYGQYVIKKGYWWGIDHHWTGVIGNGLLPIFTFNEKIVLGPEYGLYLNLLTSSVFQANLFSGFNGVVSFLQSIHLLFIALVSGVIVQRVGFKRPVLICLSFVIILLVLAPTISGFAGTIQTPNQSPIRFLFIPLTLLCVPALGRLPNLLSWILAGMLNAAALLYNLETGLVCVLGTGFALFIRSFSTSISSMLIGGIAYGLSLAGCGYMLIVLLRLALPPLGFAELEGFSGIADLVGLFANGYGGKHFSWYLPFFIILAHIFYLFTGWLKNISQKEPVSGKTLQSMVLAGMIIAFAPYMVNRFYEQNMWLISLLYILLLLPVLASRKEIYRYGLVLFLFGLLFPQQLGQTRKFIKQVKYNWQFSQDEGCLNGLASTSEICRYLEEKASELRQAARNHKTTWISATPLSMIQLTGLAPSINKIDAFAFARTQKTHREIVASLSDTSPEVLLIDRNTPDNPLGVHVGVYQWQKRIISDLGYRIVRESDYWIYARKAGG